LLLLLEQHLLEHLLLHKELLLSGLLLLVREIRLIMINRGLRVGCHGTLNLSRLVVRLGVSLLLLRLVMRTGVVMLLYRGLYVNR